MEVILPCAGTGVFPGLRPKYLLCDYSGKMMVENAAQDYIGKYNVTVVILKEHVERYDALNKLNERFDNQVRIVVLDQPTQSPAHTVYNAINVLGLDPNAPMLIRDVDAFWNSKIQPGNVLYVAKLSKYPTIRMPSSKSYTITNDQGIVNNVIEKQIVSDNFCAGGYQFNRIENFIKAFLEVQKTLQNIFISNIVDFMISTGEIFFECEVNNFVDVGTLQDWLEFNDKPTYFCDIDGTIVKTGFEFYENWKPIIENIEVLLNEYKRGCKIIFCTSRKEKYREITRAMLDDLGFVGCDLIMGLHHSRRVVINDFARSNPYPSAVAVNLKRDDNSLKEMLF